MKREWRHCRNILCIRPDNMGDLLMSTPAIRALKETFGCRITVLTSSMAARIARHIPEIDEIIQYDLPWIKTEENVSPGDFYPLIDQLRSKHFDAAIIFTVYSQNPLPSAMIAYLAGVPLRLGYCRENPYQLLTDWVPDKEPYSFIQHQVRRDIKLVMAVGARASNHKLSLNIPNCSADQLFRKLVGAGVDIEKPFLLVHSGVSETKREYPAALWVKTCKRIISDLGYQVILTGGQDERALTNFIQENTGRNSFSLAGTLSLEEFILLINASPVIVSVNTGTIHIAAALAKPVVVLYALTNPQHAPWKTKGKILLYDVVAQLRSKNEVIRFVSEQLHPQEIGVVSPAEIVNAIKDVLLHDAEMIPEMINLQNNFALNAHEVRD